MCNAKINQSRFLSPGNHFNRKAQRRLCLHKKLRTIFCHTKGIGCNSPHSPRKKTAQAFAKTPQRIQAT